jgi:hypothetical protein
VSLLWFALRPQELGACVEQINRMLAKQSKLPTKAEHEPNGAETDYLFGFRVRRSLLLLAYVDEHGQFLQKRVILFSLVR